MVAINDAVFLKPLFDAFERQELRYAVLRNAEQLPANEEGGDIDLLLHPDDFERGVSLVYDTVRRCGGSILSQARSTCYRQLMAFGNNGEWWWGITLDMFSEVRYLGVAPLLGAEALEERVLAPNGVYALENGVACLLGVIKEFVYHGHVSGRYAEGASRAITDERCLRPFSCLGPKGLAELKGLLSRPRTKLECAESARRFRRALGLLAFRKNRGCYCVDLAAFYTSKVLRFLSRPGKVIAVLGTDGAGKSTILEAIRPLMVRTTHRAFIVQHLKPEFLPPLARLKGKKAAVSGPVVDPHGSTPSGLGGSLFRLAYLTADYVLGYWAKVVPQTAKIPTALYVFDRYAYDILLDPRRFRISLPSWVIRLFLVCVPRPDLIICLVGDPQVIAARKKELPLFEVRRQVDALARFAEAQANAVLIETTRPLEETCRSFLEALLRLCAADDTAVSGGKGGCGES